MASERFDRDDPECLEWEAEHRYWQTCADAVRPLTRGIVLDIGCGLGYLSAEIASRCEVEFVIGTDRHTSLRRVRHPKLSYVTISTEELVILETSVIFETVVCTEHIEHLCGNVQNQLLLWIKEHAEMFVGSMPDGRSDPNPYHVREWTSGDWRRRLSRTWTHVDVWTTGRSQIWTCW